MYFHPQPPRRRLSALALAPALHRPSPLSLQAPRTPPAGALRPVRASASALALAIAGLLLNAPLAQAQEAASGATAAAATAATGERESLEQLRQTTLSLIEALVQSGVLTREKADALLAEARQKAEAAAKAAAEQAAAAAASAANEPPVVRVPYVPQAVRDQIRNEVREEVIARARLERWGVPNATAEWTDRIAVEGDVRFRQQYDAAGDENPSPYDFRNGWLASGATRAPDFGATNSQGVPTASTQDDRQRLRLRARLGFKVKVAEGVSAELRLATGSATDRVSTNQTLGQNFNRYQFMLDRAYIKLDPASWVSVSAGRIPNPWFSTDLVWSDNLNFEGVAGTLKWPVSGAASFKPYATLGYFPVRERSGTKRGRHIAGWQLGAQWEFSDRTRLKFGLAQYLYGGFTSRIDPDYDLSSGAGRSYGQYEYEAGLRQRGNSLFVINNPNQQTAGDLTYSNVQWGLAMDYRPWVVTAAAELLHFAPTVIGLSGELVVNEAFSLDKAYRRSGNSDATRIWFTGARRYGVGLKTTVGAQTVRDLHDWQVSLGYRWLGSDALVDAFVDSDLGLGGTNITGVVAGMQYGIARDTQLGLRYLTGRTIASPTVSADNSDRYSFDSLQVDLNVRF